MSDTTLRTLNALRRVRRAETGESRRVMAEALAGAAAIEAEDAAIAQSIAKARHATGDFDRDSFAAWLMRMLAERTRLATAAHAATHRIDTARAELAQRRLTQTAVDDAVAAAEAVRDTETARRDQAMLEDTARAISRVSRR